MRLVEIKNQENDILNEALWWVERWVSGSMSDPDWDESWIEHVDNIDLALVILQKKYPSKSEYAFRYLALNSKQYKNLRSSMKIPKNGKSKYQSFTTDLKIAYKLKDDLYRNGKHHVIVKCMLDSDQIMVNLPLLNKKLKNNEIFLRLEDWLYQKEIIAKIIEPINVIEIYDLNG